MDISASWYRYPCEMSDIACELDDEEITEQSGYYTIEQMVSRMYQSGEALHEYRYGLIDGDLEDDDEGDDDDVS